MMKIIALLCITSLLCGCQCNAEYVAEWQQELGYDLNTIEIDSVKTCSIIPLSKELVHAKDFWVYRDSVLVVLNKPACDYFIEVYDLKSGKRLTRCIMKGNGPTEMLNCNARLNGDNLYVRDFVKGNYTVVNLDEIVQYKNDYQLGFFKRYKESLSVYDVHEIGGRLLCLNPYCFYSPDIGVDNLEPRFFYEGEWKPGNRKLNAFNVSQGHIVVNDVDRKVLFAGLDLSQIEIYDFSLTPLVKVNGPKNLNIKYVSRDGRVTFYKTAYYSYLGACGLDDCFYVTYSGQDINNAKSTYIFKFDWSGNVLKSVFVDKYLATISPSSIENVLYVRGKDDDGETVMYKLEI